MYCLSLPDALEDVLSGLVPVYFKGFSVWALGSARFGFVGPQVQVGRQCSGTLQPPVSEKAVQAANHILPLRVREEAPLVAPPEVKTNKRILTSNLREIDVNNYK